MLWRLLRRFFGGCYGGWPGDSYPPVYGSYTPVYLDGHGGGYASAQYGSTQMMMAPGAVTEPYVTTPVPSAPAAPTETARPPAPLPAPTETAPPPPRRAPARDSFLGFGPQARRARNPAADPGPRGRETLISVT